MKKRVFAVLLCLLTLFSCLPVSASAAKTKLRITKQPQDCSVVIGETIRVSVAAQGDGLKYQWYYKDTKDKAFMKSSKTSSTYSYTMEAKRDGRQVYCVVKDKYGNSVRSDTATISILKEIKITQQPKSSRAAFGKTLSVSVTAKGNGLKYQWYYRDAGSKTYLKSSTRKATYSTTMKESRSGRYLYCVIKDSYGNTVKTQTVRLYAKGSFKASSYDVALDKQLNLAKQLGFTTKETLTWKSSDTGIAKVSSAGVVTGLQKGSATITVTGKTTGIQASCKVVVGRSKQIALTFDDGPSNHTARLLDYLEDNEDIKVTFFMVGNRINSYKTSVKRMAEQGHELGYHSYAHKTQTNLSSSQILSDYNKSNKIIKGLTGKSFTVWRTPGGSYNSRVLQSVPLPHIMWSVDTRDWETKNATKVYNSITNNAKDGAIILLHDLHGTTVDGAIKAMKKLQAQGYEFVTVTELLSRDGTPPKAGSTYSRG